MSQQMHDLKPLFLSAEEAMGLLDLCIMSQAEFDREKYGVLLKLSDLVRQHLADGVEEAREVVKPNGEDSQTEPSGSALDSARYGGSGLLPMPGAEPVAAHNTAVRRSALTPPCPAGRFRSWTAPQGV